MARKSPSFANPKPSGRAKVVGNRPPLETLAIPAKPGLPRRMIKHPARKQGVWEIPTQPEKFMKKQQLSEKMRGLRWEDLKIKSLKIGRLVNYSVG